MPLLARISDYSTGLLRASFALLLAASLTGAHAQGADPALYAAGEKIFKGNCASCHKPVGKLTGPELKGAKAKWEGKGDIYAWVKNSQAYLKTGNEMATKIWAEYQPTIMTPVSLTNEEIDAALYYADNFKPKELPPPPSGDTATGPAGGDDNTWIWLVILALIFLIVGISLSGMKRDLENSVREIEGKEHIADMPRLKRFRKWAWEHKVFMSFAGLFVVIWLTLVGWDALWVIGVYGGDEVPHYKPEQPIAFDHTLHAGKVDKGNLGINCQYCHSSAEKSKHAGIPSANVCMNCHKAVDTGRNTGKAEIAKIYAATGWDPAKQAFSGTEQPIRWVKVHNLPDHVAFSHATHVSVGKLECQECHGPIDEQMDVAEQWSPLTMGWCIQCHSEKEVKREGNGYYDEIMTRLNEEQVLGHRELKEYLEDGKITVKELGGWECSKCHY